MPLSDGLPSLSPYPRYDRMKTLHLTFLMKNRTFCGVRMGAAALGFRSSRWTHARATPHDRLHARWNAMHAEFASGVVRTGRRWAMEPAFSCRNNTVGPAATHITSSDGRARETPSMG